MLYICEQRKELRPRGENVYTFQEGILPEDGLYWVREQYANIVRSGCGVNNNATFSCVDRQRTHVTLELISKRCIVVGSRLSSD